MTKPTSINEIVAAIKEMHANRGLHSTCLSCPVNLTCIRQKSLGYFCAQCNCFYSVALKKRVRCDAARDNHHHPEGTCPSCAGGEATPIIEGVNFDWNEDGGGVR